MKTYQLTYHCDNCDHTGPVEIAYGTVAPEKATCTNCGCETAKRYKPIQVERRIEYYPSILPQITIQNPPVQPPPKPLPNQVWCGMPTPPYGTAPLSGGSLVRRVPTSRTTGFLDLWYTPRQASVLDGMPTD